ncbi:hypothetical protein [Erwinia amylovora]|uniref:hypothetical protein n=1 Tax=Erwinia amylovora TaxID=552 RepID=UPI001443A8C7|nr:hypothetical protein [Erwinia amylovora]
MKTNNKRKMKIEFMEKWGEGYFFITVKKTQVYYTILTCFSKGEPNIDFCYVNNKNAAILRTTTVTASGGKRFETVDSQIEKAIKTHEINLPDDILSVYLDDFLKSAFNRDQIDLLKTEITTKIERCINA